MLPVAVEVGSTVEAGNTTVEPTMRTLHGRFGIRLVRRTRTTLIKRHHDVRAYLSLYIHHALGGKQQFAAVDMAGELHAFLCHLADVGEGEYLVAAGVGKYGSCPSLEAVQPTRLVQDLRARAEVEVVGVAEDDLRLDIVLKVAPLYALHGAHRADGHEDGREDVAVVGMNDPGASRRTRIGLQESEHRLISCWELRVRNFAPLRVINFVLGIPLRVQPQGGFFTARSASVHLLSYSPKGFFTRKLYLVSLFREDNLGAEGLLLFGGHEGIRHDDDRVAYMY